MTRKIMHKLGFFKTIFIKKYSKGFSLIEIMMIIALTALLISSASAIYSKLREAQYRRISIELIERIRLQQTRSCALFRDDIYGVKFESDRYTLYKGSSWETRDPEYDEVFMLPDVATLCWSLLTQANEAGGGSGGEGSGEVTNELNFYSTECKTPRSIGVISVDHQTEGTKTISVNSIGHISHLEYLNESCGCEEGSTQLMCEEVTICHHPPMVGGHDLLCNGQSATVYVEEGRIIGGPDDGQLFEGTLNGTKKMM